MSDVADAKAGLRAGLDLSAAVWRRPVPGGDLELAFLPHADGATYVLLRTAATGPHLVFTPAEWDAFVAGAQDGEFDNPW